MSDTLDALHGGRVAHLAGPGLVAGFAVAAHQARRGARQGRTRPALLWLMLAAALGPGFVVYLFAVLWVVLAP